jgi:3-phosphoshikimate 1-carboxyvinyltransferase
MKRRISSSKIDGEINAPASKSAMIRAVAAALLAKGTSEIVNPSFCTDGLTALDIADTLGAEINYHAASRGASKARQEYAMNHPTTSYRANRGALTRGAIYRGERNITIKGNEGLKEKSIKSNFIDCGESGLCMRMFASIASLLEEETTLEASGSLLGRPVKMVEALRALGVTCRTEEGFPPIKVKGNITAGSIEINGAESSQFLTGLLMTLPLCSGDSRIKVIGLKSKPYVELTIDIMDRFGVTVLHDKDLREFYIQGGQQYKPCACIIEGDWSGAAFFLVAGALAGSIKVKGLDPISYQADAAVIRALNHAGARVEANDDYILVAKDRLNAFEFDARDCPDLFPPLVALGAGCLGKSIIYGVERLKHKESDRALALVEEFSKLGIEIRVFEDRMEVNGGTAWGGIVDSHNDHRIAMACAIAGIAGKGDVDIEGPACVSKSYPSFFEDLNSVKVKYE